MVSDLLLKTISQLNKRTEELEAQVDRLQNIKIPQMQAILNQAFDQRDEAEAQLEQARKVWEDIPHASGCSYHRKCYCHVSRLYKALEKGDE